MSQNPKIDTSERVERPHSVRYEKQRQLLKAKKQMLYYTTHTSPEDSVSLATDVYPCLTMPPARPLREC